MPGSVHPLVRTNGSTREIPRIAVQVKLVTGTYILQANRAAFNQMAVDPMCLLCKNGTEDLEHFLLQCAFLRNTRERFLDEIKDCVLQLMGYEFDSVSNGAKVQILVDFHKLVPSEIGKSYAQKRQDYP